MVNAPNLLVEGSGLINYFRHNHIALELVVLASFAGVLFLKIGTQRE